MARRGAGTAANPRRGVRAVLWTLAAALSTLGVTLALVSGSWLPLLCIAGGLSLPLIPVPSPRS